MFKKLLIILIPFLLTGCASVKYDLEIKKDLSVNENVFMTATSEYFSLFYKNNPSTIVKGVYDSEENSKLFKSNNYSYEYVTEDVTYPGILVSKTFNTLSEYTSNTVFKDQNFGNIYSVTNDNLITLKATDFMPYTLDETDVGNPISNLKINIKLPFVVVDNNASKYDKKTNTYTWEITEETLEKEINLTFDKNKIYVYNLVMYISMLILILLVGVLIFIGYKLIKKSKINNKIIE